MNQGTFDSRAERVLQVNAVIAKLDPTIRAAAFGLFTDYVAGDEISTGTNGNGAHATGTRRTANGANMESFFAEASDDKPSDNVYLAAAWHFGRHGSEPFEVSWINRLAKEVGMTVSKRVDVTLLSAQHEKKMLFTRAGRGKFKPTVHGEKYLKETYGVAKGTQQLPPEENGA